VAGGLHNALSDYIQRRTWHPSQKIKELKDGRILLSMTVSGKEKIKAWILSFGPKVEVFYPKPFGEEIREGFWKASVRYT
jgi:predicted DNA-binding transcriptional regulator YafY